MTIRVPIKLLIALVHDAAAPSGDILPHPLVKAIMYAGPEDISNACLQWAPGAACSGDIGWVCADGVDEFVSTCIACSTGCP